MIYPKRVMTTKELVGMGFPKQWLTWVSNRYNQKVVWKASPKSNSKMYWDTDELEKIRISDCKSEYHS